MKINIYGTLANSDTDKAIGLCEAKKIPFAFYVVGFQHVKALEGRPVSQIPHIFCSSDGLNEYIGGYTEFEKFVNGIK